MNMGARVFVALVAAGTASLTGCGAAPVDVGPGAADPQATLETLVSQIYGTQEQREAGRELAYLASQKAIAECTLPKGVTYGIAPYVPMLPPVEPSPGDLLGFAPKREDFGIAASIQMRVARGEPVNPGLAAVDGPAAEQRWFQAVESCQNAGHAGEQLEFPAGQSQLAIEFEDVLRAAQDEAAPDLPEKYASCMAAAGIKAADLSEAYISAANAFSGVSDATSDPTKLPGWAAAVAYERKAAKADWTCRASDVPRVIEASVDRLAAFARDQSTRLAEVAHGWAEMPRLASQQRAGRS
jgi:hypothetical protein